MQTALKLTFKGIDHSDAVEARVRERVARLEQLSNRITACHVVIDAPHRHAHAHLYDVRVKLEIPGHEIVVNRESRRDHAHAGVHVALRDAFDAVERQLGAHRRAS